MTIDLHLFAKNMIVATLATSSDDDRNAAIGAADWGLNFQLERAVTSLLNAEIPYPSGGIHSSQQVRVVTSTNKAVQDLCDDFTRVIQDWKNSSVGKLSENGSDLIEKWEGAVKSIEARVLVHRERAVRIMANTWQLQLLRENIFGVLAEQISPGAHKVPVGYVDDWWSRSLKRPESDSEKAERQATSLLWLSDLASALREMEGWPGWPEHMTDIAAKFVDCYKAVCEREGSISVRALSALEKLGERFGAGFRRKTAEIYSSGMQQADAASGALGTDSTGALSDVSVAPTPETVSISLTIDTDEKIEFYLTKQQVGELRDWLSARETQNASQGATSQGGTSVVAGPASVA